MAKEATVSEDLAKKFATEKETPYTRWVQSEGLEIISGLHVPNLHTVELKPWPRRGGRAVFINHDASRTSNDCYVCEIPPGRELAPQRQLYEEMIYVLDGAGYEIHDGVRYDWKAGDVAIVHNNCVHQHFNADPDKPARALVIKTKPMYMFMNMMFQKLVEPRPTEPAPGGIGFVAREEQSG